MSISKSRQISKLIDLNGKLKGEFTDSDFVSVSGRLGIVAPSGMTVVSSADTLPVTATNGDQAFVTSTNRLYAYSGAGWYNIGLINSSPYWITEPDSDYTLELISIDSDVKIIVLAGDSDDTPLTYIATVDSDFNVAATITHDSDRDNVWVINRRDSESGAGTTGNVTFKASDGVNLVTFVSTFTISENTPAGVTQASNYGFMAGGQMPAIAPSWNYIQKVSFSSDGDATDVGDLTDYIRQNVGASSSTHGYSMGGFIGFGPNSPSVISKIEKYSHSSDGNSSPTGNLYQSARLGSGLYTPTHGIYAGGSSPSGAQDLIQSFSFASEGTATDTGANLLSANYLTASNISSTHGYLSGGYPSSNPTGDYVDIIQKFPFASNSNATDVGNLLNGLGYASGNQSTTHGYVAGGIGASPAPGSRNEIQKFPFASDGNSTDVANLTVARYLGSSAGMTSTSHGYTGGGSAFQGTIDKFSTSSDADATDVGDMLAGAANYATTQN